MIQILVKFATIITTKHFKLPLLARPTPLILSNARFTHWPRGVRTVAAGSSAMGQRRMEEFSAVLYAQEVKVSKVSSIVMTKQQCLHNWSR